MKTTILFISLLFACFSVVAQDTTTQGTADYLNEKYGFRDATFEKPVNAFKSLRLVSTKGREKIYTRATDKLSIGRFPVKQISYVFYDGLLSDINIAVEGAENVEGVLTAMVEAYGAPEKDNRRSVEWLSTRVRLSATIAENLSSVKFTMLSVPMGYRKLDGMQKKREDVQKAGIKAASDL